MPPKFRVGDKAKFAAGRWLKDVRPGRVVTIVEVIGTTHGGKCYYRVGNNGKATDRRIFRSDDLKRLGEYNGKGAWRRASDQRPTAIQGVNDGKKGRK